MSWELKACGNCGRQNLPESSYCDLCGSPFEIWVECTFSYSGSLIVEPDYPEAVFPDRSEYPEAVFATIIR
jgi:RNA polymerase subunit RPABC4/transcription elongation factor Spt4